MDTLASTRLRVERASSDAERLAALIDLASALFEFDAAEAVEVADQAVVLAERIGDPRGKAWARHNRAWAIGALGRLDEALGEQLAVLADFEYFDDPRGVAHALTAIGDIHNDAGDTSTGLDYLERAIAPMTATGDLAGQAVILNLTGIALGHQERHREAASVFEQAEQIFTQLQDPLRVMMARLNRGFELLELTSGEGEPGAELIDEAARQAAAAIDLGLSLGEDGRNTEAYGRSLMSLVHAARGEHGAALAESEQAERVAQEGGFDGLAVEIALDRIPWLIADDRLTEARTVLEDVEVRSAKSDNRRFLARAAELRAGILESCGDLQGALSAYREFHRMDRDLHGEAAERRSRLTSARLEVERARREAELARTRIAELEALDHDKRDFLASVSHELRTPLAAVLGFATELADSWEMFSADEARGLVQLIARQSADISGIVDDLLTITRLEAGTMSVFPKPMGVMEHIRGLVDTLAREANRQVQCDGDATVWADPARLRQVIRNLVTNAFRHGGEKVRVVVEQIAGGASVEVRDSGGPIPDGRVQTMFNPFDHSDDGIRTPNSVGLGLAVARSLARMMGGELDYVYEEGESVFRVSLPAPPAS